ncbi:MAG: CPXCG motif-containing cysteine-rich protein [Planctomycetota bacterium]
MLDEARYVCDSCGEEVEVPIDLSAGSRQSYVEDCPVCCNPTSFMSPSTRMGSRSCGQKRNSTGRERLAISRRRGASQWLGASLSS